MMFLFVVCEYNYKVTLFIFVMFICVLPIFLSCILNL